MGGLATDAIWRDSMSQTATNSRGNTMAAPVEEITRLLGGKKTLGVSVKDLEDLMNAIRKGLPYASLDNAMQSVGITREEVARVLAIPLRTIARRKQGKRLQADESDRLYRLIRIVAHAIRVFGDREKAGVWLHRPNRALAGAVPLSLLDNDIGTPRVDDVLTRIEHGVFG
jgi:putative toxin-antitoxin system antitoxin component (TIGR02293 family)